MDNSTIKNILDFLEKKENKKHKDSDNLVWKLRFGYSLTKEDLIVNDDLDLRVTNITSLPEGLKVRGSLNLGQTIITSLPEGLEVGGYLSLIFTKITSLPEGLEVGNHLFIQYTEIKSLPEGLKVGGDLYINSTPLTKYLDDDLRQMVKPGFIKGKIIRS